MMPEFGRLAALARKEMIYFLRDRVILALILFLYTAEVLMCVYALTLDVQDLPTAVSDLDRTVASRELIDRFDQSGYFRIDHSAAREAELEELLDRGEVLAAIVVPPGFAEDLTRHPPASVQLILDGADAQTASIAQGYADRIVQQLARERATSPEGQVTIEHQARVWYIPELTDRHFTVLSMIALAGMMVGVITAAAGIVREKEAGTIEQLLVSPVRPTELIAAKMIPPLVVGLVALFPALVVAAAVGVPLEGGLALFLLFSAMFLLGSMAMGILIATFTETLQQALLMSFFVLFPVLFLSGTLVPAESMPQWLQLVIELSPLYHYLEGLLGLFLKGVGLEVLWPRLAATTLIALVLLAVALGRLRRRLG